MFLLLLFIAVAMARAQSAPSADETVDSNQPSETTTVSTTTTTTIVTGITQHGPAWIHFVRVAALAGPIAFLLLAWLIGAIVHYRLVRREQEQFPQIRGSRMPQTVPMIISGTLFLIPVALFLFFEIRSRKEIALGSGGVIDEWQPVTAHAWIALVVCLVLAMVPWLFARRADTV
jgi:heme/copper-type cytochrome/quinol oxidase subunit 2